MSPIYLYQCKKCKTTFELIRRIAEANEVAFCENCGEQCEQSPAVPSPFVWGKSGGWS